MENIENYTSVIQTRAADHVSNKYTFIPTTRALDVMAQQGWFPAKIKEARVRDENKKGFQRHIIRLRNEIENRAWAVGEEIPEAVLINSHGGTSAFSLMYGLFRKICSNGAIVQSASLDSFRITHVGYTDEAIFEAIKNITINAPKLLERVESFKSVSLTTDEQLAFASAAIELKFDGEKYKVEPKEVLKSRRWQERHDESLWGTFNRTQENILRGGIGQQRNDGTRIKSRAVTSIVEDTRLNKALWTLTEEMASLKGVQLN